MKPRTLVPWLLTWLALPLMAQEGKLVVLEPQSKELKRAAHRLGIPAEQLRNARRLLQEATDLACRIDPPPFDRFHELTSLWQQINGTQAQAAVKRLIDVARSAARDAADIRAYQNATSTAFMMIGEVDPADFETAQRLIRGWPPPPASEGKSAHDYLGALERQLRRRSLQHLALNDPDKALSLIYNESETDVADASIYSIRAQLARSLMDASRRDEALLLIDRTMDLYARNPADPGAIQAFDNFLRMVMPLLDGDRAAAALEHLIAASRTPRPQCGGSLTTARTSIELSCAESRVLGLLRFSSRPGLTMKALEALPGLKAKLDGVGGIDVLFQQGAPVVFSSNASPAVDKTALRDLLLSPDRLYRQLRGKGKSDPGFARAKLREAAGGPGGMNELITLAHMAAHNDPELADIALEEARSLLPGIQPLEKRSSELQNLIRACRAVDGEVGSDLLREGFILADRMRREEAEKESGSAPAGQPAAVTWTRNSEWLESFLVAETARDDLDAALRYIRPLPTPRRFACLVAMAGALRQANY